MSEILDTIDDNDNVIGQADRDRVHREGLLIRIVYVCFYTPDGYLIFQKRSSSKQNDPGKLTTTASGHVASGQSYLEAAVRETYEETGIQIEPDELQHIANIRADCSQGNYLSSAIRGLFAYKFTGSIDDLRIEALDGDGLELISLKDIEHEIASRPDRFSMALAGPVGKAIIHGIKQLRLAP